MQDYSCIWLVDWRKPKFQVFRIGGRGVLNLGNYLRSCMYCKVMVRYVKGMYHGYPGYLGTVDMYSR